MVSNKYCLNQTLVKVLMYKFWIYEDHVSRWKQQESSTGIREDIMEIAYIVLLGDSQRWVFSAHCGDTGMEYILDACCWAISASVSSLDIDRSYCYGICVAYQWEGVQGPWVYLVWSHYHDNW